MEENLKAQEKRPGRGALLPAVSFGVLPALLTGAVLFAGKNSAGVCLAGALTGLFSGAPAFFLFLSELEGNRLSFENGNHPSRLFAAFLLGMAASAAGAFLPEFLAPLSCFGVLFLLLSSPFVGFALLFPLLITGMSAQGEGGFAFCYYALCALVLMVFYLHIPEHLPVGKSLAAFAFARIALFALGAFFSGALPGGSVIFSFAAGLLLEMVILLVVLPKLERSVVFPWRERFGDINDPEYVLLMALKKDYREQYRRAIHTAYLSDRLALRLGADRVLTKAVAYYHNIGLLLEGNTGKEATLALVLEYSFPPSLVKCLGEYPFPGEVVRGMSRETALAYLCSRVVTAICDWYERMPEGQADYESIIDEELSLVRKDKNILYSELTFADFFAVRKHLKREKLYYDFLR